MDRGVPDVVDVDAVVVVADDCGSVVVVVVAVVAVRVYTPGGRDGSKHDHSYPLTYTPIDVGMTVGMGGAKEDRGVAIVDVTTEGKPDGIVVVEGYP